MSRISRSDKCYKTQFTSTIKHIIPFNDKFIWFYFKNGLYQVWELTKNILVNEKELELDVVKAAVLNDKELAICSASSQSLQILNIHTGELNKKAQRRLPTLQAIPEADQSQEKLRTMWNDGLSIVCLPESNCAVVLEKKGVIGMSNDSVITCFHEDSDPFFFQTIYTNQYQRTLYLSAVNNKDTIVVYGPAYIDQPLEFFLLNVLQKDTGVKMIRINNNINCQIIAAYGWSDTEVCFVGNPSTGVPYLRIVDTIECKDNVIKLDYIEGGGDCDFFLHDSLNFDPVRKTIIVERISKTGNHVDLYSIDKKKLLHSMKQEEDDNNQGLIRRNFAPNGGYFIEYFDQQSSDDLPEISFKICWVMNSKTVIMHLLEQAGIANRYGDAICKEILGVLI